MVDYASIISDAECVDVFLQPTSVVLPTDTFVINFLKDGSLISFHSYSLVRMIHKDRIIYTVTDHYLNRAGNSWRKGQGKLSTLTYPLLKTCLIGRKITSLQCKKWGDVSMFFENGAILEFLVDATKALQEEEVHRIIVFESNRLSPSKHYILKKC